MKQGSYDTAQVCLNGHAVNSSFHDDPETNKTFCSECGEPTITECPDCETEIQGHYRGGIIGSRYHPPHYCHNCGKPFPWTVRTLDVARELAEEFDELDETEKDQLKESLEDLIKTTPRTPLAQKRFKKIMAKVGRESYEAMKGILTDIVSETIRKIIFSGDI